MTTRTDDFIVGIDWRLEHWRGASRRRRPDTKLQVAVVNIVFQRLSSGAYIILGVHCDAYLAGGRGLLFLQVFPL